MTLASKRKGFSHVINSKKTSPEAQLKEAKVKKVAKKFVAVKNPMPFDLARAQAGISLVTRSGEKYIYIGFDERLKKPLLVAPAAYKSSVEARAADGHVYNNDTSDEDIFLNITSKEMWVALYTIGEYDLFPTREDAVAYTTGEDAVSETNPPVLKVPLFKIMVEA